ncbi:MAG: hypothetical protein EWM47_02745 [Anaerolineaceae bacterium]|nr:MAG: hypothetical protein EWM47_02745 [Anaerolineaceae bacterium]
MNRLSKGFRQSYYTMFHPVNGFDAVKWENAGSIRTCFFIMFLFFLVNVFDAVLTGFIYNTRNPDRISIISIFAVSIGGIILWFISNWAVSSLMFTEGKTKHILILTCYSLLPYIIWEFIYIVASNFVPVEMAPFLSMLRFIGLSWSFLLLVFGSYQIHQISVGKVFVNILLTVLGVFIMLFLMLLGYSLIQQMYIFAYTIFSEVVFRL